MSDSLTPEMRSRVMRAIKGSNTKPELAIRKLLFSSGYRYRLHQVALPGRPDIVFPSRKKVIFVHGCFWHVHKKCGTGHIPDSPAWRDKLQRNLERDRLATAALRKMGWKTLVVWECEINSSGSQLLRKLSRFLDH